MFDWMIQNKTKDISVCFSNGSFDSIVYILD